MIEVNRFRYATIQRVVDGDTVDLAVECLENPSVVLRDLARLDGLQAADEPADAKDKAREGLRAILDQTSRKASGTWLVIAKIEGREKYGRLLVRLYGRSPDGEPIDLNQQMLTQGFAVPWDGHGPRPPNPR